ncbi:hypothetical protein [Rhizohabitans arisaemae]|uniref:hypothetical protein n=1 Tax=Rhizohabitans arisaemae TaxID=2720610 RepID=UPI0024B18E5A|nr:hypothetical protein [Rhizohabitans arisaemae]
MSASVLLAAGLVVGTAGPALAVPTGCSVGGGPDRYYSICTGGTGLHSVYVIQAHRQPGMTEAFSGPWQPVGTRSEVVRWPYHGVVVHVGYATN